jgi:hypothetical protein
MFFLHLQKSLMMPRFGHHSTYRKIFIWLISIQSLYKITCCSPPPFSATNDNTKQPPEYLIKKE